MKIVKDEQVITAYVIDFDSPEVQKQLSDVKEEIKKVLEGQKIDYAKLSEIFITI